MNGSNTSLFKASRTFLSNPCRPWLTHHHCLETISAASPARPTLNWHRRLSSATMLLAQSTTPENWENCLSGVSTLGRRRRRRSSVETPLGQRFPSGRCRSRFPWRQRRAKGKSQEALPPLCQNTSDKMADRHAIIRSSLKGGPYLDSYTMAAYWWWFREIDVFAFSRTHPSCGTRLDGIKSCLNVQDYYTHWKLYKGSLSTFEGIFPVGKFIEKLTSLYYVIAKQPNMALYSLAAKQEINYIPTHSCQTTINAKQQPYRITH